MSDNKCNDTTQSAKIFLSIHAALCFVLCALLVFGHPLRSSPLPAFLMAFITVFSHSFADAFLAVFTTLSMPVEKFLAPSPLPELTLHYSPIAYSLPGLTAVIALFLGVVALRTKKQKMRIPLFVAASLVLIVCSFFIPRRL